MIFLKVLVRLISLSLSLSSGFALGSTFTLEKTATFGGRELTYFFNPSTQDQCNYILTQLKLFDRTIGLSDRLSENVTVLEVSKSVQSLSAPKEIDDVFGMRDRIGIIGGVLRERKVAFAATELSGEDLPKGVTFPAFELPVSVTRDALKRLEFEVTPIGIDHLNEIVTDDINLFIEKYPFYDLNVWRDNWKIAKRVTFDAKQMSSDLHDPKSQFGQYFITRIVLGLVKKIVSSKKIIQLQVNRINGPPTVKVNYSSVSSVKFISTKDTLTMLLGPQTYTYDLIYDVHSPR